MLSNSFVTPSTIDLQAPLSMVFNKQEYRSGFPFPFLGDLPDPGIKPARPALAGRFFPTEPPGNLNRSLPDLKGAVCSKQKAQQGQCQCGDKIKLHSAL